MGDDFVSRAGGFGNPDIKLGSVDKGGSLEVNINGRNVKLPPSPYKGNIVRTGKPGEYKVEIQQTDGTLWNSTGTLNEKDGKYFWK